MSPSIDQDTPGPSDGLTFYEYRERAIQARAAYLQELSSKVSLPRVSLRTKRGLGLFAMAFVVATGAFWANMLTSPPKTEAVIAAPAGAQPGTP
jgi:hypothetical protein